MSTWHFPIDLTVQLKVRVVFFPFDCELKSMFLNIYSICLLQLFDGKDGRPKYPKQAHVGLSYLWAFVCIEGMVTF